MTTSLKKFIQAASLSVSISVAIAQGPTAKPLPIPAGVNLNDPQSLLAYASSVNGLVAEPEKDGHDPTGISPWHIKATYETFDDSGRESGSGVFEEWHISARQWKRTYSGPHFTQTEYQTSDGHFYETEAGGAPWPDSLIEHVLVHPMPRAEDTEDTSPTLQEQSFGKSQ
jgi:hypothetical protein